MTDNYIHLIFWDKAIQICQHSECVLQGYEQRPLQYSMWVRSRQLSACDVKSKLFFAKTRVDSVAWRTSISFNDSRFETRWSAETHALCVIVTFNFHFCRSRTARPRIYVTYEHTARNLQNFQTLRKTSKHMPF